MKIQIIVSDKEKELFGKVTTALGESAKTVTKSVVTSNAKWGIVKDDSIEIHEACIEDAVNLTIAIIPKIKGLVTFIKSLIPLIKGSFDAFGEKWVNGAEALDLPDKEVPGMKTNGKNSSSVSTAQTSNSNKKQQSSPKRIDL